MNRSWSFTLLLFMALFIVLAVNGLAACGADQSQATGAGATAVSTQTTGAAGATADTQPTVTQVIHRPTSTPARTPTGPTLPAGTQNCGRIATYPTGKLQNVALAQVSENCFWQDYQQCRPAGLFFQSAGVDTVTVHNLQTAPSKQSSSGCAVMDTVSLQVIPRPPTVTKYTCMAMTKSVSGLHFANCGGEPDFDIPMA